jgi:hypothetical protein
MVSVVLYKKTCTLYTPLQMHVELINKFSFIQPDDSQTLWPKHVVVIYV